jgi:hypothetical protein
MLPFLKPQKVASVILAARKPDGSIEIKGEEGEHEPGLIEAAHELINAVHGKDSNAVASALKAAFEIMESEPHDENEQDEGKE